MIALGESLALVGENGAGKITLGKLLSRIYKPTSGTIYFDGVDLREYDLDPLRLSLRSSISLMDLNRRWGSSLRGE
jgi:ATP-binding cassette subfamily B protein